MRVDRPEPRGGAGRGELGVRPQEAGKPGRADDHRGHERLAEQLDRLVARRRAGEQRRNEFERGKRRLIVAHGDLVARRAVDHVEQHPRQLLAGERAQRGDAVTLAFDRSLVHQTSSR